MKTRRVITVFEHQTIQLGQVIDNVIFDENQLNALQKYYGKNGVPFFTLIHKGIRFNQHVGVIQVGNTVYEILPKADVAIRKLDEKSQWRHILIDMLFSVGLLDIKATSSSLLKLKSNSILDLYFELFIKEVEYLFNGGLAKKYRSKEGNVTALKGRLKFVKHIQNNLTHHERFYVQHIIFDAEHLLHSILFETISLLKIINTNAKLNGRIDMLLLYFSEMPHIKVTEYTFQKITYNRQTQGYKNAIDIAKLLLLQFHPDVVTGKNNVLALMFDMNKLWEKFVYVSLRKHKKSHRTITEQTIKNFWQSEQGAISKIKPDIVINNQKNDCVVLDTKWKNLNSANPSLDDLRQMFVYHEYFNAKKVALIYPGKKDFMCGNFLHNKTEKTELKKCFVVSISAPGEGNITDWQNEISNTLNNLN